MTDVVARTAEPPSEVEVTPELARALLSDQHPDLADLPIAHAEDGWDNVMLRLGDELALRMPRRKAGASLILTEQAWLPLVAPGLPLPAPIPLRTGLPGRGYPYRWSVVPWFDATPCDLAPPGSDEGEALAAFLKALHRPAPDNAPMNPYRGVPLAERAAAFEAQASEAERRRGGLGGHVRRLWTEALAAPINAPRTWFHGDLHGRNVLVKDARLAAVIDWGDMAAGDAACDLAAVWMLLPDPGARGRAIAAYDASGATWARARGWAALMSVTLLTIANNPRMPAMGAAIVERLEDGP
jgi:aminoglycoside phosphotransferase (APT) family kinase protein